MGCPPPTVLLSRVVEMDSMHLGRHLRRSALAFAGTFLREKACGTQRGGGRGKWKWKVQIQKVFVFLLKSELLGQTFAYCTVCPYSLLPLFMTMTMAVTVTLTL